MGMDDGHGFRAWKHAWIQDMGSGHPLGMLTNLQFY
jgi:hypothetical protein